MEYNELIINWGDNTSGITTSEGDITIQKELPYSTTGIKTVTVDCLFNYDFGLTSGVNIGLNEITDISLGNTVTSIKNNEFANCFNLSNISIPNSVVSIGDRVFYGTAITGITLPVSVVNIGDESFTDMQLLNTISVSYLNYNLPNIISRVYQPIHLILSNPIELIPDYFFVSCDRLSAVTFSNSITEIGAFAFGSCVELTTVNMSNSITEIGTSAFGGCVELTTVNMSNSITTISERIFYSDSKLINITLSTGLTYLSSEMFSGCLNLSGLTIPNNVYTIDSYCFSDCSSLQYINIPDSVNYIYNDVFNACQSLTGITIGSGITLIGSRVFIGDQNLVYMKIKNTIPPTISDTTFLFNDDLEIYVPKQSLSSYQTATNWNNCVDHLIGYPVTATPTVLTVNVVEGDLPAIYVHKSNSGKITVDWGDGNIDNYYDKINDCEIIKSSSYTITGQVNITITCLYEYYLYTQFFNYPSGVISVNIGQDIELINSSNFYGFDNLVSVYIPNSVTFIGGYSFYNCSSITGITISNSVITIDYYAFGNCTSLTSIIIPDSVTHIRHGVFDGCSSLTDIIIGSGITNIDSCAFCGCDILSYFKITTLTPPTIFANSIPFNVGLTIYVPQQSLTLYQNATNWIDYASYMVGY